MGFLFSLPLSRSFTVEFLRKAIFLPFRSDTLLLTLFIREPSFNIQRLKEGETLCEYSYVPIKRRKEKDFSRYQLLSLLFLLYIIEYLSNPTAFSKKHLLHIHFMIMRK